MERREGQARGNTDIDPVPEILEELQVEPWGWSADKPMPPTVARRLMLYREFLDTRHDDRIE